MKKKKEKFQKEHIDNDFMFNALMQGMSWDQGKEAYQDSVDEHEYHEPTEREILTDWIISKDMEQEQFACGGKKHQDGGTSPWYVAGSVDPNLGAWDWKSGNALASGTSIINTGIQLGGGVAEAYNRVNDDAVDAERRRIESQRFGLGDPGYRFNQYSNLQFANTGLTGQDVGGMSTGEGLLTTGKDLLSGATTGAAVGGVPGAIIGGAVGLGAGLWSWLGNKYEAERLAKFDNKLNGLSNDRLVASIGYNNDESNKIMAFNNRRGIYRKKGGFINEASRNYPNRLTEFNEGGNHEDNPNGGVQQGINPNDGRPNLVEQDETKWNDYIFSKRILADGGTLQANHLDKKYDGWSFADISKDIYKVYKERPNDPISRKTFDDLMPKLQTAQEAIKLKQKQKAVGGFLDNIGDQKVKALEDQMMLEVEEQAQMEAQAEQERQQQIAEQDAAYQDQLYEQAAQEGLNGQDGYYDNMMALGGRMMQSGGWTHASDNTSFVRNGLDPALKEQMDAQLKADMEAAWAAGMPYVVEGKNEYGKSSIAYFPDGTVREYGAQGGIPPAPSRTAGPNPAQVQKWASNANKLKNTVRGAKNMENFAYQTKKTKEAVRNIQAFDASLEGTQSLPEGLVYTQQVPTPVRAVQYGPSNAAKGLAAGITGITAGMTVPMLFDGNDGQTGNSSAYVDHLMNTEAFKRAEAIRAKKADALRGRINASSSNANNEYGNSENGIEDYFANKVALHWPYPMNGNFQDQENGVTLHWPYPVNGYAETEPDKVEIPAALGTRKPSTVPSGTNTANGVPQKNPIQMTPELPLREPGLKDPDKYDYFVPQDLYGLEGTPITEKPSNGNGTQRNPKNYAPLLRFAPMIGSGLNYMRDILGMQNVNNYSDANLLQNEVDRLSPISYVPIGGYMEENPIDREYLENQARQQSAAAMRQIANASNGNRGFVSVNNAIQQYNLNNAIGDLGIKAAQQDLIDRRTVAEFNARINQINANNSLSAAEKNQAIQAEKAKMYSQVAQMRTAERYANEAAKSQNESNFFENTGAIGKEIMNARLANSNLGLYYGLNWLTGDIYYKPAYYRQSKEKQEEMDNELYEKYGMKVRN